MTGPNEGGVRVAVRPDELDGTVIDAGPDSVLGLQLFEPIDGLGVWVDPLDPARLVRVTCADIDNSSWFLDELLGQGAAAAIAGAQADDGVVTVRPTQVARDAGRVGLLLWLENSSPLPLDQGLLDAEIAAATRGFPGMAMSVRDRARAAMSSVLALSDVLANGAVRPPPSLARVVFSVAGVVLGCGSPDDTEARALVRLAGAARAAVAADAAANGDLDDELLALFDSSEDLVDWEASWAPAGDIDQRFSIDWRVVPRGVLDTREGTIRVRRSRTESHLLLEVAAIPGASEVPLFARIVPGDGADPVAVTRLRFAPETASYRGILPVSGLADRDRVDVFSASASIEPLRGRSAERRAAALRCAARGFTAMRMATAAPIHARTLWRSSADEWTEWLTEHVTANTVTTARDRDVVLAALARCQRQLGSPAALRTLGRRVDPGTEPVWADPSLDLSLAEGRLLGLV